VRELRTDWVIDAMSTRIKRAFLLAAGTGMASVFLATAAFSQNLPNPQAQGSSRDRMLIEAREMVYNNDQNTVEARGSVQIFYQGRTLEADRVTYNRGTRRVFAEGNARLTESNGQVVTGSRFELTDDFKDGFIDTLRTENPDKSRFAAPRAERSAGDTVSFDTGTYTACEPCKDNPEKPPLWQVRSKRIIHKGDEKTIYFEGSTLEFAGIPVGYMPYFWSPDSTVKRQTGLLAPTIFSGSQLGYGAGIPIFINLAPNYDITLTPTFLSRQGFLGVAEWRHRLSNGSYTIRGAGISQADPDAFARAPVGGGSERLRGAIESFGEFDINDKWRFGWDVAGSTDRYFYRNYRFRAHNLTTTFFQEVTSTAYLNGQSADTWFDMRGYYFRPLSYLDAQKQQPLVHPVLDYNRRFDGPGFLGGEITVDANITSLSREHAAFQTILTPGIDWSIGKGPFSTKYLMNQTDPAAAFYEGCFLYNRTECLLRGIGGTANRASLGVSWRRRLIDPVGQVWTPFASVRADGFYTTLNGGAFNNDFQGRFGVQDGSFGRVMPAIGLNYEYPLLVQAGLAGNHVISPIAQIIARPNEQNIARTPNEDAQSVYLDDTNLFQMSRFSGYDRNEGGIRTTYGVNYAGTFANGAYANAMFGQSVQLSGRNSYSLLDNGPSGQGTGLETRRSDFVARAQISPAPFNVLTVKGRFDEKSMQPRAIEASALALLGPVTASATYARFDAQPERSQPFRREGAVFSGSYKFANYWSARGSVFYDLDKYLSDRVYQPSLKTPRWTLSSMQLGLKYADECTIFDIVYTTSFKDSSEGTRQRTNQSLMFRLELRTLGAVNFRQAIGEQAANGLDGIRQ
jgi:LPS-assembly protein